MLFKLARNNDGYYNITLNDSEKFMCKELIRTNEITDTTPANALVVQSQFDPNQCLFEIKDLSQGKQDLVYFQIDRFLTTYFEAS